MNAFHPALTGVLYGALAQHEQAMTQMQLAHHLTQTDGDGETYERYAAIVDGLKRMIKTAEPVGLGDSVLEAGEKMRHVFAVAARVLSQLSDFDVSSLDVSRYRGVHGNLSCRYQDANVRDTMREAAERLGLEYGEQRHINTSNQLHITAKGQIDGVDVELYELMTAERPFCDTHNVMLDADDVCLDCVSSIMAYRHAMLPDGTETPRCGATDGIVALLAEDVTCLECATLLADQLATTEPESDPGGLDAGDDLVDDPGARYTADQLAGIACAGCGLVFAEHEPSVRAGHTPPGGGMVIDIGLRAHPDCTDMGHPELEDDAS